MQKITSLFVIIMLVLLAGCSKNNEVEVVKTYRATDYEKIQECFENNQSVIMTEYSELSDGTWKCGDIYYKYRLEITGRLAGADQNSTYVYLSNIKNISFEQAWKAAGLSSDMKDYFAVEDAILVEMK